MFASMLEGCGTAEPCDEAGRCTGYCGGPCPSEVEESEEWEER